MEQKNSNIIILIIVLLIFSLLIVYQFNYNYIDGKCVIKEFENDIDKFKIGNYYIQLSDKNVTINKLEKLYKRYKPVSSYIVQVEFQRILLKCK